MEKFLQDFDESLTGFHLLELTPEQKELLCKDEDQMKNLRKNNHLKKKISDLKEQRDYESHNLVIPDLKIRNVSKATFQSLTSRLPDLNNQLNGHVNQDRSAVPNLDGLSAKEWASVFYHCGCGTGVIVGGGSNAPLKRKPTDNILEIPNNLLLPYFQAVQETEKLEVKITQNETLTEAYKTCDFEAEIKVASPFVSANCSYDYFYSGENIKRGQECSCVSKYLFPVGDFILAKHNICTHQQPCDLEGCIKKFKVNQVFVEEVRNLVEGKRDKLKHTDFNNIIARFGDMFPTRITIGLGATGKITKTYNQEIKKTSVSHQMQTQLSAKYGFLSGGGGVEGGFNSSLGDSKQSSDENISWTTIGGGVMTSTNEPRSLVQNRQNPHLWRVIHTADFISFKELLPHDLHLAISVAEAKPITYVSGEVYEGDYMDDKRNGKGKNTWANGEVYEGDWKDGKGNGKGKNTWANGEVYEGDYMDGKRNGKGKYTYVNGEVYEGDYMDDKRHGKGKFTFASGEVYEGDYMDDKRTWEREVYFG